MHIMLHNEIVSVCLSLNHTKSTDTDLTEICSYQIWQIHPERSIMIHLLPSRFKMAVVCMTSFLHIILLEVVYFQKQL